MPQDSNNRSPRYGGNRPPVPGEDPNQQPQKRGPRFSIYWIYAIIFAVLIGFQVFGPFSRNMAKISSLDFRNMVAKNSSDIAKYTVVDNRKMVKVYLTKQGKLTYDSTLKKGITGKVSDEGPHMYFKITSGDAFEKEMSDFYARQRLVNPTIQEVQKYSESEKDWFGGVIQFLLPVLLFVGLWILLMRKMGGGAGAGGGVGSSRVDLQACKLEYSIVSPK